MWRPVLGKNAAWLKCIDATKAGDVTATGEVWSYTLEKHVLSTPAFYNGLIFIADCGRKFHCLDVIGSSSYIILGWVRSVGAELIPSSWKAAQRS